MRFDALSTSNNVTLNENGVQTGIGTRTGSAGNTNATNPAGMVIFGDLVSTTATGSFVFAAAAVFHAAHANWLQQKVEGHMAHDWRLAGDLSIAHAYRSRPPLLGPG
jgi:hypothetical protein